MKIQRKILAVLAACGTGLATAGDVTGLVTFQSDTKALAAEVNGNFTAVKTAVDDNNSRVTTNTADIATNTAGIATNTAGIATNTAGIATNTADIATNTADIATNAAGIATNAAGIATNAAGIATNATGIATNAADIATNATGIATNATDIATNATGISTNAANIATNTTDIATNAAAIAVLQPAAGAEHVAYVSPSGGNYADPVAAMADLATWCGTPSATNLCLLKIMPGAYDLGAGQLVMQPFVDVEGSGEAVTRLTGAVDLPIDQGGVVVGANDAELRNLTVESKGTGSETNTGLALRTATSANTFSTSYVTVLASGFQDNVGIYVPFSSMTLKTVTVRATGAATSNVGIYPGGTGSTPHIVDADVTVSGGTSTNIGIRANNTILDVSKTLVSAAGTGAVGVQLLGVTDVTLSHVSVSSSGDSVGELGGPTSTVLISHSLLDGAVSVAGGPSTCAYVANAAYTPLMSNCL